MLARQSLARDAVGEGLRAVSPWLAQMPHEQRYVGPDNEKHLMVHGGKAIEWRQWTTPLGGQVSKQQRRLGITEGFIYL